MHPLLFRSYCCTIFRVSQLAFRSPPRCTFATSFVPSCSCCFDSVSKAGTEIVGVLVRLVNRVQDWWRVSKLRYSKGKFRQVSTTYLDLRRLLVPFSGSSGNSSSNQKMVAGYALITIHQCLSSVDVGSSKIERVPGSMRRLTHNQTSEIVAFRPSLDFNSLSAWAGNLWLPRAVHRVEVASRDGSGWWVPAEERSNCCRVVWVFVHVEKRDSVYHNPAVVRRRGIAGKDLTCRMDSPVD